MFSPYPIFIGIRYAGAKRRSQLVSFISWVSMLGMTLGVALLIVVLSVMNGFDREMQTRILGLVPHITIAAYSDDQDWQTINNTVLQHSEVEATAPFTQFNGMLLKGTDVESVAVYGIDPAQEKNVSIIHDYLEPDAFTDLEDNDRGIILGAELAKRLDVSKTDYVNMMVPLENAQGRVAPRFARFQVVAVFKTGTEIDQSLALMPLSSSEQFLPANTPARGMRISVGNLLDAPRIAWELSQNIPYGYVTRDWTRNYGNLYSAIQLSKQLVGLMLLTIIAVAAFNVVSALVMIVTDKRGDIAILRTAGASQREIMAIFMTQGTLIAVVGTVLGTVIGILLSLVVTDAVALTESLFGIQFLNSDVYPIDYLPSDIRVIDVLLVCGTAFVMSLLATLYPAWRASRVQPAEALRYE